MVTSRQAVSPFLAHPGAQVVAARSFDNVEYPCNHATLVAYTYNLNDALVVTRVGQIIDLSNHVLLVTSVREGSGITTMFAVCVAVR
jgi:hypothetical protein